MTDLEKLVESWAQAAAKKADITGLGEPDNMYIDMDDYDARPFLAQLCSFAMAYAAEEAAKVVEQTDEAGEGPDCWGCHSKDYARAIRERFKAL